MGTQEVTDREMTKTGSGKIEQIEAEVKKRVNVDLERETNRQRLSKRGARRGGD